jgi:rubrerythrin
MTTKHITSLEALGIAIRSEIDAQNLYEELTKRTPSASVGSRFKQLLKEEKQHQQILTDVYNRLFPQTELKLPPSVLAVGFDSKDKRSSKSLLEVLQLAIDEERKSREFYLDAAEQTPELSGKKMFRFLADMEYSHQMRLQAEYEMCSRYPNYFSSGQEPWKPEQRMRRE